VAMDSYFLPFDRIKFYCLGQEAIELNRIRAVKRLESLKEDYRGYQEELEGENKKKSYLDTQMEFFGEYNYDAAGEYEEIRKECAKKEAGLRALVEAQKNKLEYMELAQRVADLDAEGKAIDRERQEVYENKSKMQTQYHTSSQDYDRYQEESKGVQERL